MCLENVLLYCLVQSSNLPSYTGTSSLIFFLRALIAVRYSMKRWKKKKKKTYQYILLFIFTFGVEPYLACVAGGLRRVATKRRGVGETLRLFALSQSLLCRNPIWRLDRRFTGICGDRQLFRLYHISFSYSRICSLWSLSDWFIRFKKRYVWYLLLKSRTKVKLLYLVSYPVNVS